MLPLQLELHAAHAIATFSELGIGAATLLIVDVARWRAKVKEKAADPIAFNDLCVQAKRMGWVYQRIVAAMHSIGRVLDKILFLAPYASVAFGVFALVGISIHTTFEESTFWWCSIVSFALAFLAALVEKSGAKVSDSATATAEQQIP